uniref:C-type lectin domain-containing protein n=1 Tax=Astyanax mexicanus TaxID=7994 RepID=A0A8B9LUX4_ASTMX
MAQDGAFKWVDNTDIQFSNWNSGFPKNTECSLSLSLWSDFHCDEGYLLYGNYCYHFEAEMSKTWQEAEAYCVSQSGHLASIPNQETTSFITVSLWMGGHDSVTEGDYLWSDGSALSHTNWGPGEPNDHAGRENCVELVTTQNGSSYWNDIFCDVSASKEL